MLDRLIDLLLNCLKLFQCWDINLPYHQSAVLRLGKFNRMCGPGLVWLLPFHIDMNHQARMDINSNLFQAQSMMTSNGDAVTAKMACVWKLVDAKKFLLEIADDEDVMYTQTMCTLAEIVRASEYNQLLTKEWHKKLNEKVKDRADKFGIEIMKFEVIELVKVDFTLRLYNELNQNKNQSISFVE